MYKNKMMMLFIIVITMFLLSIFTNCGNDKSNGDNREANATEEGNVNTSVDIKDLSDGVDLTPEDINIIQAKYKTVADAVKEIDGFVKAKNYKLLKYILNDQREWGNRKAALEALEKIKTTKAMSIIVNSLRVEQVPSPLITALEIIQRNCYKKAKDYIQAKVNTLEKEKADAIRETGNLFSFYSTAKNFLKDIDDCKEVKLEDDGTVEEEKPAVEEGSAVEENPAVNEVTTTGEVKKEEPKKEEPKKEEPKKEEPKKEEPKKEENKK